MYLLVNPPATTAVQDDVAQLPNDARVIPDSTACDGRVRAIFGVQQVARSELEFQVVSLSSDNIPFLSAQVIERPLWRVTLATHTDSNQQTATSSDASRPRTFHAYIDPISGTRVKIESEYSDDPAVPLARLDAESAAAQIRLGANETYHGFPSHAPETSFSKALDALRAVGADPDGARHIVAYYVLQSTDYDPVRSIWAITLRGVPPIRRLPDAPADNRYEYRYIIDDETGRCESLTNVPSALLEPQASK